MLFVFVIGVRLRTLAHKMKGGATYGTVRLYYALLYMERYIKAGHTRCLEQLYTQMLDTINDTVVTLDNFTKDSMVQSDVDLTDDIIEQESSVTTAELSPHDSINDLEFTKTPRVLLIEDDEMATIASQAILMKLDCFVETADSESRLKAIFEPGQNDLVLMDISLEDTSGYQIAKYIKAQEQQSGEHVPIIALTGYPAENLMSDCKRYHIEGAITKPLTMEQARQLIQRYVFKQDVSVVGLITPSSQD